MANAQRKSMSTWIILAVIAIVVMLFAGLLPLPGQKDNVTPTVQPSPPGTSPQPVAPKGPPPSPSSEPGKGTQPPPGGTPGSAATATSGSTPQRDSK